MSVFTNPAAGAPEQASEYITAILGLLGDRDPVEILTRTASALRDAFEGLTDEQLRQPEASGKWSIAQVLQHLADGELVWGYRLRMILAHDRPAITGYDQDLWASRLHYDDADPVQAIEQFQALREANLVLVGRASPAERQRIGVHAERGEETVDQTIRLTAGHDLLHLRQIARIRAAIGTSV